MAAAAYRRFVFCLLLFVLFCACENKPAEEKPSPYVDKVFAAVPDDGKLVGPGQLWDEETVAEAGLDANETTVGQAIIDTLVADPRVDFVATYIDGSYEIHARRGTVRFRRYLLDDGTLGFHITATTGENPVKRQDPMWLQSLREMLKAGSNPTRFVDRSKPQLEYDGPGDPRMRFLTPEDTSYPYPYSRVAAVFDSPDAPDLAVTYAPYAGPEGESGHYGELNIAESRGLLMTYGPGLKTGAIEGVARLQDIAPTAAKLLGIPLSPEGKHLLGQDGRALNVLLTGETAPHVLVINLAGLSDSAFDQFMEMTPERFGIYRQLLAKGGRLSGGTIAPFPTGDWPCQFTLATGADVGRHGMIDDRFFRRATALPITLASDRDDAESLMASPVRVETLFEAVARNRHLNAKLNYSAALGLLATRGAEVAPRLGRGRDILDVLAPIEPPLPAIERFVCNVTESNLFAYDGRMVEAAMKMYSLPEEKRPAAVMLSLTSYLISARRYGPYSLCAGLGMWYESELIARLLQKMAETGAAANTAVLIVSDHGMRGVDLNRSGSLTQYLKGLGFTVHAPAAHMLYLPTLKVGTDMAEALVVGENATLKLRCTDGDSGLPLAGVKFTVLQPSGGELFGETDKEGTVTLKLKPDSEQVIVEATHDNYNPTRLTFPVEKP